jgi:hypothetical protein
MDQITELTPPVTVAARASELPSAMVAVLGLTVTRGPRRTRTWAEVFSALADARTVYVPSVAGAEYVPVESIVPPPASCTDHATFRCAV